MSNKRQVIEQSEDIGTLIGLVANQEYADATNLVTDLLNTRVTASLDEYKQHVAKNLFAPSLTEEKDEDKDEDEDDDNKDEDDKDSNDDTDDKKDK